MGNDRLQAEVLDGLIAQELAGKATHVTCIQFALKFIAYTGHNFAALDADLAAPDLGLVINDANFYDGTTAFTFGIEGGALIGLAERLELNVNLGFRYTGGMSDIDPLVNSGLEDINDDSGRWTLPVMVGLRFRF